MIKIHNQFECVQRTLWVEYIRRSVFGKKSVMIITLHDKQQICVDSRIRFQHRADSGRRYAVVLSKRQLQNLNDTIIHSDEFHSLLHFPLGGSLWRFRKENITKLFDNKRHLFFSFYASAWHFYVRSIHKSLYEYIIHGKALQLSILCEA